MGNWFYNEGPKWAFLICWLGTNLGLFIGYFLKYWNAVDFYYLNQMLGLALPFARGSAACLNFNCMLILIPVCRNLITLMRGSFGCCKRNIRRQLDKNITFHKCVAYMIVVQTFIHYGAHCFNVERFILSYNSPDNATRGLLSALSHLPAMSNGTWINPIRDPQADPTRMVFSLVAGVSGVVITLCLILMITSSTEFIRRSYFEVFWYTHHLFVVFFIGLVIHGVQGVVKNQSNVAVHDPKVCSGKYSQWGRIPECPMPQFGHDGAQTWKWVIAPMILYFCERCVRFYRSQQKVVITKVVKHPSRVIELQMKKRGFSTLPGQYIFLHCPAVSRLEWHPFTLTSCPEEDHFSVHIRTVGDWTNALATKCGVDMKEVQEAWNLPQVAVDGPFGTASEDFFRYQVDIFVAAGIGVTPFASVLKHIWYKYNQTHDDDSFKLRKVYFYWICPDTNAFEWFSDLLQTLENQMAETGKAGFLEYNIYLTRGWDANQAKNIFLREQDTEDVITGLQQKTFYGRPDWDREFKKKAEDHAGTSVGVFFCGPKVLSNTLHRFSNMYSSAEPKGVRFYYNKENF